MRIKNTNKGFTDRATRQKMENDDDEEAPLAVQIEESLEPYPHEQSNSRRPENDDVCVGVTVITGYLGAGKSTVKLLSFLDFCISKKFCDLFIVTVMNGFALSW